MIFNTIVGMIIIVTPITACSSPPPRPVEPSANDQNKSLDKNDDVPLLSCCPSCGCPLSAHITHHTSHISHHTSHITRHTSHITHHTSHITHQTSHITHHTSHITHHTSHVTRQVVTQTQSHFYCSTAAVCHAHQARRLRRTSQLPLAAATLAPSRRRRLAVYFVPVFI